MKEFRAGFVGVIGLPNAGKSSVVNALVQDKVAIVTPKAQTTRRRALGLVTDEKCQIVFVDAPGLVEKNNNLNQFLRDEMDEVIKSSDCLLAVLNIDADRPEDLQEVLKIAKTSGKPWMAFVNKTDIQEKAHRVAILVGQIAEAGAPYVIGNTQDQKNLPREEIINFFYEHLPPSPAPLYDVDLISPQSVREIAAEIVREKCFTNLHNEVPYSLAVRIEKFDESKHIPHIHFEIIVGKDAHKGIILGQKGQMIKKIASEARTEIEKLLGTQIFMAVQVRVEERWASNKKLMKELGYVIESK